MSETWQRFGRNRRRVLRFAWLTLLPDITALPESSQRRDMDEFLQKFTRIAAKTRNPYRCGHIEGRPSPVKGERAFNPLSRLPKPAKEGVLPPLWGSPGLPPPPFQAPAGDRMPACPP